MVAALSPRIGSRHPDLKEFLACPGLRKQEVGQLRFAPFQPVSAASNVSVL